MLPIVIFAGVALTAVIGFYGVRHMVYQRAEKALIATKPNGRETPADVGLAYERFVIHSGERQLEAWFVRAAPTTDAGLAVLIFHGRSESISDWVPVLHYFCSHGCSSMVFDYSGFGNSTGAASAANLRQDVQAAYRIFQSKTGPQCHTYVLGLSLGSGFLLEGLPAFSGPLDGIILVGAYSSARDAAIQMGTLPVRLAFILPDVYNNVRMVKRVDRPLLIIHSQDDEVFPVAMAHRLYAAAREPKRLVVVRGLRHNSTLEGQAAEYLSPALEFMGVAS